MLNLKDEEPHRTVRRTGVGRRCGPEYEWLFLRSSHWVNPGCKNTGRGSLTIDSGILMHAITVLILLTRLSFLYLRVSRYSNPRQFFVITK